MRVLTVIAHYYKPEAEKGYGSTDAAMRDHRYKYLEEVLLRWRVLFGSAAVLDMVKRALCPVSSAIHVDILILKVGDNHVVSDTMKHKYDIKLIDVQALPHPRLLPFAAHQVMAQYADKYDWFVYSEDDIGMVDTEYFHKCKDFMDNFGGGIFTFYSHTAMKGDQIGKQKKYM